MGLISRVSSRTYRFSMNDSFDNNIDLRSSLLFGSPQKIDHISPLKNTEETHKTDEDDILYQWRLERRKQQITKPSTAQISPVKHEDTKNFEGKSIKNLESCSVEQLACLLQNVLPKKSQQGSNTSSHNTSIRTDRDQKILVRTNIETKTEKYNCAIQVSPLQRDTASQADFISHNDYS